MRSCSASFSPNQTSPKPLAAPHRTLLPGLAPALLLTSGSKNLNIPTTHFHSYTSFLPDEKGERCKSRNNSFTRLAQCYSPGITHRFGTTAPVVVLLLTHCQLQLGRDDTELHFSHFMIRSFAAAPHQGGSSLFFLSTPTQQSA